MSNHASRHVPVNSADHSDLRVQGLPSPAMGDAVMSCPALPIEFRRLQNEFPILFQRDFESGRFKALALMGFEEGENLFFDGDRWIARYRPLVLAAQPFLVGRSRDPSKPSHIHINLDHPRVGDPEGTLLFDEAGHPSPYLKKVASLLEHLDVGLRESDGFFDALERYQLLEPFALDVKLADGTDQRLVGYHLINEDRLRELEEGAIAELHRDGHLMPMFMALASLSNMPALVDRKESLVR